MNAAKYQLQIKSPSKKAEKEIGVPFAQGIGVGIEDGMKEALRKIRFSTNNLVAGLSPQQNRQPTAVNIEAKENFARTISGQKSSSITQNNTFTAKTLSPYEQRVQLKKLDNDLAEVFA